MANISAQHIDDLNVKLTVQIPATELSDKFKKELNRFTQKAALKGFRKGKTPMSYIQKIYGNDIMSDLINDTVSNEVGNFLQEKNMDILGRPIPAEDTAKNTFSVTNIQDLEFSFDIGLAPAFEVQGLDKQNKFVKLVPEVPVAWIDDAIEAERKRHGATTQVDSKNLQDKDLIKILAKEKDGSIEKTFAVLFEDLTPEFVKLLKGKKVGDSFDFDILKMEKDKDEAHIRKYILDIDEQQSFNPAFSGTLEEINRITPADLDEAFFTKAFGAEVTTEEAARAFLYNEFAKYFESDSWGLLVRDLQERLLEMNQLNLPETFLKRWLAFSSEKNTPDVIEKDFDRFSANLRWTLIRDHIIEKYHVHVHNEDIAAVYKDRIRASYGAQLGEEFLDMFAQRMMDEASKKQSKEHEDVVESAMFNQVFKKIAGLVDVTDINVTWEEFNAKRELALEAAKKSREGESVELVSEETEATE